MKVGRQSTRWKGMALFVSTKSIKGEIWKFLLPRRSSTTRRAGSKGSHSTACSRGRAGLGAKKIRFCWVWRFIYIWIYLYIIDTCTYIIFESIIYEILWVDLRFYELVSWIENWIDWIYLRGQWVRNGIVSPGIILYMFVCSKNYTLYILCTANQLKNIKYHSNLT